MSEPAVDLETHIEYVASLTEFIHREIGSYVEQHKLDPVIGVLSPLMAASVLSMTHAMIEHYIQMGETLNRRSDEMRNTPQTHPQHPAVSLTPHQTSRATLMGQHLNDVIQKYCEPRDQGPNVALAALLTAAAEQAGASGHLATFYTSLQRILDGHYRIIAAEQGGRPAN